MAALASVWLALAALLLATAMLVYRPAMTDVAVTLVLYFGAPGALCLAILTLWAHREDDVSDRGLQGRRLQAKVAMVFALAAAAIVYALIVGSEKLAPVD